MVSLEDIAKAMYAAYLKQAMFADEEGLALHAAAWDKLDAGTQACWLAAAQAARNVIDGVK